MFQGSSYPTTNHERAYRQLCSAVDVDEEFLEVLTSYVDLLVAIGIDLSDRSLQQAIEGNINHLESACRAVIGYAGWLAFSGRRFQSEFQATYYLFKALTDHWQPHPHWDRFKDKAAQARYVSPYEEALTLIYRLNWTASTHYWDDQILDDLPDEVIAQLIPGLRRELDEQYQLEATNQDGALRSRGYQSSLIPLCDLLPCGH